MEPLKEIPIRNILKTIKWKNAQLPMPLEMQVCAPGFAMRLKELGVKQESLFYWAEIWDDAEKAVWKVFSAAEAKDICEPLKFSAFTVGELGVLMSDRWRTIKIAKRGWAHGRHGRGERIWGIFDSEADARASAVMGRLEDEMTAALLFPTI